MSKEETLYHEVASKVKGALSGQLFGKPCYKINKKAFCCFFQKAMVFKLNGEAHQEAMSYDATHLFDPSGKGRPMKEWVQVPFEYCDKWETFAAEAAKYVGMKS